MNYINKIINIFNPNTCDCGIPWEKLCQCPENILESFSLEFKQKIFYYEDFAKWMENRYSKENCRKLINDVLNLEGVQEIGDSAYKTPYEVD